MGPLQPRSPDKIFHKIKLIYPIKIMKVNCFPSNYPCNKAVHYEGNKVVVIFISRTVKGCMQLVIIVKKVLLHFIDRQVHSCCIWCAKTSNFLCSRR